MTLNKEHRKWIVERIYNKLLKSNTSRTIKYDNFKEVNRDVDIRGFNALFEQLANKNYALQKPKTNTWYLVEDNPVKYTDHIDVDDSFVNTLEKYHGRRQPEAKGAVKKDGGYEQKYG